jgi:hypothetical protein
MVLELSVEEPMLIRAIEWLALMLLAEFQKLGSTDLEQVKWE